MSNHNEIDQQSPSTNSNNYGDILEVYMPCPSRTGLQPSTAIQGMGPVHFGSLFSGGYYANLDPQFQQTTPYFGEQTYYNDPRLVGTPGQQVYDQNNHPTLPRSDTQDSIDVEQADLYSTTAMMQDAIAAVLGGPSPSNFHPQADFGHQEVVGYTDWNYQEHAEPEASTHSSPPPIHDQQEVITNESHSQAPDHRVQDFVESNGQTDLASHNQPSFEPQGCVQSNRPVQEPSGGITHMRQYPAADAAVQNYPMNHDLHNQLPSVLWAPVETNRPVQATSSGSPQLRQPLAAVNPVQHQTATTEL
jgi:hypothetical protein